MLIVRLFVSYAHVNLCHFFSSSWCRALAAASACGSSWTFLFTFLDTSKNLFSTKRKILITGFVLNGAFITFKHKLRPDFRFHLK